MQTEKIYTNVLCNLNKTITFALCLYGRMCGCVKLPDRNGAID